MKTMILACMMFVCLSLVAQTAIPPTEGSGTAEDPLHIDNFGHLYYITLLPSAWGLHFIQTADIDATDSVLIPSDEGSDHGWLPIGRRTTQFTGSYDGQGYHILNLYMNRPSHEYNGLFGYIIGGRIQRVNLVNAEIHGGHYGGVLSGVAHANSIVSYCSATGSVSGTYNIGGLIGFSNDSLIMNSYAHVSASGWDRVGGFIGTSGWDDNNTYISFCYSTGTASASSGSVGGFSGWGGNGYHKECYWDTESSGLLTDSGSAIGKSTAMMMLQSTYEMWNFWNVWSIQDNRDYPHLNLPEDLDAENLISLDSLQGQGTSLDPYQIQTIDELNAMRLDLDAYYILMADIDLSGTVIWDYGRGWQPVGASTDTPFTGSFDGNDHSISYLSINRPSTGLQGLFGYSEDAEVFNLNLESVHLMGDSNCGGVIGYARRGSLDKLSVSGTMTAKSACGGIAGVVNSGYLQRSFASPILKCYAEYGGSLVGVVTSDTEISGIVSNSGGTGRITGSSNMGGLVGVISWGYIINSYSHASVTTTSNQAGGIAGLCGWSNPGYIIRCFATGSITCSGSNAGGVVGWMYNGYARESYWNIQSSGISNGGSNSGIFGKNTAEMMQRDTYGNWNFDYLWQINEGIYYPTHQDLSVYTYPQNLSIGDLTGLGTDELPYQIHSLDELLVIHQDLAASYQLANDIDLSASVIMNGGLGWQSLGTSDYPFSGKLDGNGFQIVGMQLVRPPQGYAGLFGVCSAASIHNLRLQKSNILADVNVGGLAGYTVLSNLTHIDYQGSISARETIGGIVGYLDRSTLENSNAMAVVICYGNNYAGGLVGFMQSDAETQAQIHRCSSSGSVYGYYNSGGLVGCISSGILSNSYSHAMVKGHVATGGAVGRLGYGSNSGTIEHCYATGYQDYAPGGWSNGGLVGYVWSGTTTSCYWDTDSSSTTLGSVTGITGLTTAQMTYPGSLEHYAGWDFDTTWSHDIASLQNHGYPYLEWSEMPVPDAVQNLIITRVTGEISLQWQEVPGASLYRIYASDDPYAPLYEWSYLGESTHNGFSITPTLTHRFFMVRSSW